MEQQSETVESTDAPQVPVEEEKKQKVTAFEVEGDETGVDYDKLIKEFGCHKISPE